MSEAVKKRCIEMMYAWSKGLTHEPKMEEAYQMLKRQGIVKQDPTYVDQVNIITTLFQTHMSSHIHPYEFTYKE